MDRMTGAANPQGARVALNSRLSQDADLSAAVAAAQRGDERAFRLVFRAIQPRLLRYLRAVVGDDAEDVASEAWLQIARDLKSFRGDFDSLRGWTATIARHRALDHLRAPPPTVACADWPASSRAPKRRPAEVAPRAEIHVKGV
jgi:DNA-directed RNA polymerase specialized sigma24 family protein